MTGRSDQCNVLACFVHMDNDMQPKTFTVSFVYASDQLRGRAEVEVKREGDEQVYLARNIRFENSQEELEASDLLVEQELRIKRVLNSETDVLDWVKADDEEESLLARLIGKAIEKHNRWSGK